MNVVHQDVAVIGTEITALAAAALLAHSGLRIVLYANDESSEAELDGILLPKVAFLENLPQNNASTVLFNSLGLRQEVQNANTTAVGLDIICEDRFRYHIHNTINQQENTREFANLFSDSDTLCELLDNYPQNAFTERFKFLEEANEKGFFALFKKSRKNPISSSDLQDTNRALLSQKTLFSHEIFKSLKHLQYFFHAHATHEMTQLSTHILLAALKTGSPTESVIAYNSRSFLKKLLKKVILGHGGLIVEEKPLKIERVQQKRLQICSSHQNYQVQFIIDGSQKRDIDRYLQDQKLKKKLQQEQQQVVATGTVQSSRWLLPADALPRGLSRRAVLYSAEHPQKSISINIEDAFLSKESSNKKRDRSKDPKKRVALIASLHDLATQSEQNAAQNQEFLQMQLEKLLPFAKQHISKSDSFNVEQCLGILPHYISNSPETAVKFSRKLYKCSPIIRAGRDLCPVVGLEGELAMARSVFKQIKQSIKS